MTAPGVRADVPALDQNNASVTVSGPLHGDIVTVGGPWGFGSVLVESGGVLYGTAEAISASNIGGTLNVIVNGSILAETGSEMSSAIADRIWVSDINTDAGDHHVGFGDGSTVDLAGPHVRSILTGAVFGNGGIGSRSLSAEGSTLALDAGDYDGSVYIMDFQSTGFSHVDQSILLSSSELSAVATAGSASAFNLMGAGSIDAVIDGTGILVDSSMMTYGLVAYGTHDNVDINITGGSDLNLGGGVAMAVMLYDDVGIEGDSASVRIDGGSSINASGDANGVGAAAVYVDTVTFQIDGAQVHTHGDLTGLYTGVPTIGAAIVAAESGTVTLQNDALVTAEGMFAVGSYTALTDYAQFFVEGSTVMADGIENAYGIFTSSSVGTSVSVYDSLVGATSENHAVGVHAEDLVYMDVDLQGSRITADAGVTAAGVDVQGTSSVTLMATDADLIANGGSVAAGLSVIGSNWADLSLHGSLVQANGVDDAVGINATDNSAIWLGVQDGTVVEAASSGLASGIRVNASAEVDMVLSGGATVRAGVGAVDFHAVEAIEGGSLDVVLDNATLDAAGAARIGTGIYSRDVDTLSVLLQNNAVIRVNSGAEVGSVGIIADGDADIRLDATSRIEDVGTTFTPGSMSAGVLVIPGADVRLDNAGYIGNRMTALEAPGGGLMSVINTGTIHGGNAARGDITVDNYGVMYGRLDILELNTREGSTLGGLLTTTTSLLPAGDAYWKVSGTAVLEAGTIIDVDITPALAAAINANPEGYDYLMMRAGTLDADTDSLVLDLGPLVEAMFIDDQPAGDLAIRFVRVECEDAGLSDNAAAACDAADDDGEVDLGGDPEQWIPMISDMMLDAPRMASRMIAAGIRHRLLTTADAGMNSGDPGLSGSVWADVRVSGASQDATGTAAGFDSENTIATLGADRIVGDGDVRLGLAVSSAVSSADEDGTSNSIERDATIASLYGKWETGSLVLEGVLGMGNWDSSHVRYAGAERITASYEGKQHNAQLWVSRPLVSGGMVIEPSFAASYQNFDIDAYVEKGDGTPLSSALAVGEQSYEQGELGLGLRVSATRELENGALEPGVELMIWHDVIDDQLSVPAYFVAGSPVFVTNGRSGTPTRASLGLALQYRTDGGTELKLGGDITGNDDYLAQSVSLRIEKPF